MLLVEPIRDGKAWYVTIPPGSIILKQKTDRNRNTSQKI
jgi:hypothetical protein